MKKILVIEDNKLNLKLFYDILKYHKYDVDCAQDGALGYEKIVKNDYDLIILDIQLPKMTGFEILEKLKNDNKDISKIIVVSAYAMDEDKQKAYAFGLDTYITKPIDINNFIKNVKQKLGEI